MIIDSPFTKEEFDTIINIQSKYYEIVRESENARFELSLQELSADDRSVVIELDEIIKTQLYAKIDEWNGGKYYLYGLGKIKQVFWIGHYRALMPIIYKDLLKLNKTVIQNGFTSSKITGFIMNNYPHLKPMLLNLSKHYQDMRKEIEANQLTDRIGYKELPENPLKGFQKSTIVQLIEQMNDALKVTRDAKINKMYASKEFTQQQIATALNISQATVQRSIKKTNGENKNGK